jgi:hypothetical protein
MTRIKPQILKLINIFERFIYLILEFAHLSAHLRKSLTETINGVYKLLTPKIQILCAQNLRKRQKTCEKAAALPSPFSSTISSSAIATAWPTAKVASLQCQR